MGYITKKDPALDLGHTNSIPAWGSTVICLSAFSGSQIILRTVPITEEHKHVCPQLEPQSSVSTSPGFTSQQKIGQHKFQGYYPPVNHSDRLTFMSSPLYVKVCFAVRATNKWKQLIPAQSPMLWCLALRLGDFSIQGNVTTHFFPSNFLTRLNLCLQFPVCRGKNPTRVKLMDCDKAQFQIIALTWAIW